MYTRNMGEIKLDEIARDPVIELYKKDVDRTLLRENLRLTPQQRIEKLVSFMRSLERLRDGARRPR